MVKSYEKCITNPEKKAEKRVKVNQKFGKVTENLI